MQHFPHRRIRGALRPGRCPARALPRILLAAGCLGRLPAASPGPAEAQLPLTVEVRAGAAYSTPFARGAVLVPAELEPAPREVEIGAGVGPALELALASRGSRNPVLEVRAGGSWSAVTGKAGESSWDAGRVVLIHFLGGARVPLPQAPAVDLRIGAGKALYLNSNVNLLEAGANTGLLLSAGLGVRIPGPLPLDGLLEGQRHEFTTPVLEGAGARPGTVTRILLGLALAAGGS